MAPGPKKNNPSRQGTGKETVNYAKTKRSGKQSAEALSVRQIPSVTSPDHGVDLNSSENKKYSKRTVTSNWNKYDEPVHDPHADTMRGKDFDVLLSYSGGFSSQLQLQDEKEWEDTEINDKFIAFNLKELCHVVKSIPLHQRIGLPLDIFVDNQIESFVSEAEIWKKSFTSSSESRISQEIEVIEPNFTEGDSNLIESYEPEVICSDEPPKFFVLEKKTESIIESLASCLSLKDSIQKTEEAVEIVDKNINTGVDDLDFLLSLGTPSNATKQDSLNSKKPKTNVDDWLNSILDD